MSGRRGCLLLTIIPIGIIILYLLFSEWAWGGYVKPSLDPQYVPTAGYLQQNPVSTPAFLTVNPPPGSTINSQDRISVSIQTLPETPLGKSDEISQWTRMFINYQKIAYFKDFHVELIGGLDGSVPGYKRETAHFVLRPNLQPGLHILEIRVGKSVTALLNPAEAYSYKWAYRVE